MTNPDVRMVKAQDGAALYYEVLGSGETLVLLHGAWTSRYAWSRQREALAQSFRLILRDLRGHDGAHSIAPPDFGFDTTEVADMLAVLDAEGIDRANLVGHSTGGLIALAFALDHPERVDGLVLVEPTLASLMPDEMYEPVSKDVAALGDEEVFEDAMNLVIGADWRSRVSSRALDRMMAQTAIARAHTMAFQQRRHLDEGVSRLKVPVLFLYGDNGAWPAETPARLRERFGVDVRVIPGAGHNVHVDQPEALNTTVIEFLRSST